MPIDADADSMVMDCAMEPDSVPPCAPHLSATRQWVLPNTPIEQESRSWRGTARHHMHGPSPALESIGLMVLTQSKPLGMKMRCTWRPSGRSFLSHIFAPPNLRRNLSYLQLVVTSRCGASLVPQLAPSAGRDARCGATTALENSRPAPRGGRVVAMRRDSGCAVEVRCLLWAIGAIATAVSLVGAPRLPFFGRNECFMRCAALLRGRPERGAAGLANDVRRSHVLLIVGCGR